MSSAAATTRPAARSTGASAAGDAAALLRADTLHKTYRLGRAPIEVLTGCSLTLSAGEMIAIMGKSGSGKSTLLHLLGALDVPQRGQVYFRGEPVFAPPDGRRFRASFTDVFSAAERRRNWLRCTQFGFVFQFYHLLPDLNVLENVLLPRMVSAGWLAWRAVKRTAREDALAILTRVGLGHRLKHRPAELSGGERQRVAIARALVHRPAVLLADEPTGNLDAAAGRGIMDMLKSLHADGQTIVLVTHDESVAAYAGRRLLLRDGALEPLK